MVYPLRGAIVGFGFIAERGHLPAYLEHPERFAITAVADTCAARREIARRALPHARIYDDLHALLAAEHGSLDFVDIATPPSSHAELAHLALDHGLHVLCEKPLTTNAADAHSLLAHAEAVGRICFPSHNYRHAPVVKAVREHLDSGRLGRVHLVTLQTFRPTHARGVGEWLPDWRRMRRYSGGGIAMDHASHSFYLAFDWLGAYPTTVTAHVAHRAELDTEDDFTCTVTFPTGLAVAHLTWNAGVRKVIYSLHGDRGALTIEDDDLELAVRLDGSVVHSSAASDWMDASHVRWFGSLHEDFLAAIAARDVRNHQLIDAIRSVELIEAAYASARAASRSVNMPHSFVAQHPRSKSAG